MYMRILNWCEGQRTGEGKDYEHAVSKDSSSHWQTYKDLCFRCVCCVSRVHLGVLFCVWIEYVLSVCCMLKYICVCHLFIQPRISIKAWKQSFCLAHCWGERKKERSVLLYSNIRSEQRGRIQFCPFLPRMKDKHLSLVFRGHSRTHHLPIHSRACTQKLATLMPAPSIRSHKYWNISTATFSLENAVVHAFRPCNVRCKSPQ